MQHSLPNKAAPCAKCPFRKDTLKGWLGESRMTEILAAPSFACHKTTGGDKPVLQCAGHMIIRDNNNDFVRLANRLDLPLNLTGHELIFESETECIEHHK